MVVSAWQRFVVSLVPELNIAVAFSLRHKKSMLSKVCSAALNGIEAFPVEVEVNAGWGDTLIVIGGSFSVNFITSVVFA